MNNIKKARIEADYSQKQVALALNVSTPTISEWESGKKNPKSENLQLLATLFNVSVDYLLGRDTYKKIIPIPERDEQGLNIVRFIGRDGSNVVRKLTDDQMKALQMMVDQLPDAEDL